MARFGDRNMRQGISSPRGSGRLGISSMLVAGGDKKNRLAGAGIYPSQGRCTLFLARLTFWPGRYVGGLG